MPDPVPVKLAIQIRWRDLDALVHVNNAVYLDLLRVGPAGLCPGAPGCRRADSTRT